jgi:hypothetical protein
MADRKSKQSDRSNRNTLPKNAAGIRVATAPAAEMKRDQVKAEQDELLTEALKESFPASDPISSLRFTSP